MKTKKILFLVNHDIVIYNFRKELVERLLEEGYEVYISSPYGERIEYLISMGCHYIETRINRHGTNIIEDLNLLRAYKRIMKEISPEVVLTYTIKPNIYGGMAAQSLDIPYIANITGLGSAVENGGIMQKISVLLYKRAFRKIQTVFFQNKENQQFFEENKIAIGKHKTIPGSGVNVDEFQLLKYPSSETVEFIYISRIMKEKGIEQYLAAAKYIREKYPFTRFHILGFCEEDYEDILKQYEKQGVIEYHGMVNDIKPYLKRTHCTIHPTYYPEGMSNVLLESAASGRPVITTNRSGCREIVNENITGYLVAPKKQNELIQKIEEFIQLPHNIKEKMGKNARRKVKKEFDRQIVVDTYAVEIEKGVENAL